MPAIPPSIADWTGEAAGYATVTHPLNVREDPDLSAPIIDVLPAHTTVIVWCAGRREASHGDWRLVSELSHDRGPTGWAHSAYLAPT